MYLKTYLYNNNAHTNHPTLFKKINDICKASDFKYKMKQDEFVNLYLNTETLNQDIGRKSNKCPTL
jgi:Ca2+-binding EF-hand superfamily protein